MVRTFIFSFLIVTFATARLSGGLCIHNSKIFLKGDAYKKDDCNHCICDGHNKFNCSSFKCIDPHTCFFNGNPYKKFDTFIYDCGKCECTGNNVLLCSVEKNCNFVIVDSQFDVPHCKLSLLE